MTAGRPFPFLLGAAFAVLAAQAEQADRAATPPCPTPADSASFVLQTWPPAASIGSGGPADPAVEDEALAAYAQLRSAAFMGWARSGIHVVTRMGSHPQLYRLASHLADRRQITYFRRRADQWYVNPVPARSQALVTMDEGGDEEYSLRLLDLGTGRLKSLGCPPGRVTSVLWNDSGTAFVYAHTPKGADRWDIRLGTPGGRDTLLLSRPGTWIPMDWSPDGARLVIQRYVSSSESELFLLPLLGGEVTQVLPKEGPQYYDHAVFVRLPETERLSRPAGPVGPAGPTGLAFTSDRVGAFHRLYLLAPGDSLPRALSPPVPWDVEWAAAGGDRRTLVYSLNEQGASILHALRPGVAAKEAVRLPGIPRGVIEGAIFHPSGQEFGFTVNGAAFPGDAFTYRLRDRRCTRWTESETAGLPREGFREPELVEFPTFDSVDGTRRRIPAWLYLPAEAGAGGRPVPVLVQIHGGPEQQARAGFDPFVQFLAGRLGMAVVLPNVRGSSGYGKDYLKADDGRLRTGAVQDIGALLDWVATRPELDPERVAVAGRSYGGFMALAASIRYGDRLKGVISTVGITHFPSFLKETSGYRRDLRRAEYGDERDPAMAAFLDSLSPASHLERLRLPLLLAHGRNDPRVPYAESVRLFESLKAREVPVWLLTFPREGHAFRAEESRRIHWQVMADFLTRYFGLRSASGG